jgi:hypothetical protein
MPYLKVDSNHPVPNHGHTIFGIDSCTLIQVMNHCHKTLTVGIDFLSLQDTSNTLHRLVSPAYQIKSIQVYGLTYHVEQASNSSSPSQWQFVYSHVQHTSHILPDLETSPYSGTLTAAVMSSKEKETPADAPERHGSSQAVEARRCRRRTTCDWKRSSRPCSEKDTRDWSHVQQTHNYSILHLDPSCKPWP